MVVVVVVMVFVSMHSAPNLILGCGERESGPSKLTETVVWLERGRLGSMPAAEIPLLKGTGYDYEEIM